jgi:hypothetical protein
MKRRRLMKMSHAAKGGEDEAYNRHVENDGHASSAAI